jgi:hypothetical protein
MIWLLTSCHHQQSEYHRSGNNFRYFYKPACDLPDLFMMHALHKCSVLHSNLQFSCLLTIRVYPGLQLVLFSTFPCLVLFL